jgi:hypothetical protein
MKNIAIILLVFAVISLGIRAALAAEPKEAKVRSLGEAKMTGPENDTDTSAKTGERKLDTPMQVKMRSSITTMPIEQAASAPEKTEVQKNRADYTPYIIALVLCIAAAMFLYRSRKK